MKAENLDICATGYGNGGGETQMALCVHNGFCSGSKVGGKEGGRSPSVTLTLPHFLPSLAPCPGFITRSSMTKQYPPSLCSHGLLHQLRQMNIKTVFPPKPKDKGSKHEDVKHCEFDYRHAR